MKPDHFHGRFLTPSLTWVLSGDPPEVGYSVGHQRRLYRNGEHVGWVALLTWDRKPGGWWVDYDSWTGSAMDDLEA